ncbi:hypothetical protein DSO57_1005253 [Entomophthora muscae]|uniref:Uncharacterized protein n=1 Tax=Entomophthora muscae TaxID=34485 RepID=A0ACC2SXP4_9FUNG|nr:hypothetical protein DSO57_1005253 [Entomophthora muscae]
MGVQPINDKGEELVFPSDMASGAKKGPVARGSKGKFNPGPSYLQVTRPKDQEAIHLYFFSIESPQAEAVNTSQDEDTSKNLEITLPIVRQNKLPNGDKVIPTISLMSLKPILVANQDSPPKENKDLKAAPMNMARE